MIGFRYLRSHTSDEGAQMSAQQDRIERSLKRLGLQLGKGRGKAFKITVAGGNVAPNATAVMTLEQAERWIGDHVKPKQ
jgi:hypothetical protein